MPSLAKVPGNVRHSTVKGLAAMRPHNNTFQSQLIQLEVEFNERVRYLPVPQPGGEASEEPAESRSLDDIGTSSSHYVVYEEQFEEIIAHDNLFAHLLRRIKTEYDRQIRELTRAVYRENKNVRTSDRATHL